MAFFGWESSLGWLALLSLLPFLFLYLVRPKPREMEVPSLMFFMKSKTRDKQQSFFQKFITNWLFFLQLLILLLLSLYFVEPYTDVGSSFFVEHAVVVVDISASTQVHDAAVFKEIIKEARAVLGRSNTIILVSNTPRVGVKEVSKKDANRYLKSLRPTAGTSPLGDALLVAEKYATGEQDKIIVVSDFLSTGGSAVSVVRDSLVNKGIAVEFKPITNKVIVDNIGIVELALGKEESKVFVKNFNAQAAEVMIILGDAKKVLSLAPGALEPYAFPTPKEAGVLSLDVADDFPVDDKVFFVSPEEKQLRVLLISDEPSLYLKTALTSSDKVELSITRSNSVGDGYDVYVLAAVRDDLSKSFLQVLEKNVEAGAGLIIHAQADSPGIAYGKLLPVTLGGIRGSALVSVTQITTYTQDIAFGSVANYFSTSQEKGVSVAKAEEGSIISVYPFGKGKVVYYGILEDKSDFELSPSYPLFWTNIVKYLGHLEEIEDVHVATGALLPLSGEKKVITPSREITTDIIVFEEPGVYTFDKRVYAANLVNELESNLHAKGALAEQAVAEGAAQEQAVKYPLAAPFIIIIMILLFIELLFLKVRGEI